MQASLSGTDVSHARQYKKGEVHTRYGGRETRRFSCLQLVLKAKSAGIGNQEEDAGRIKGAVDMSTSIKDSISLSEVKGSAWEACVSGRVAEARSGLVPLRRACQFLIDFPSNHWKSCGGPSPCSYSVERPAFCFWCMYTWRGRLLAYKRRALRIVRHGKKNFLLSLLS